MATLAALSQGQIIAKNYRVVRPLGKGSGDDADRRSAVYVAEQISTGKERALKVMHPSLVEPEGREKFLADALVRSKIASENIVEVVDLGIDDATGMPWIAMELVEGETLAELAERRGRLSPSEVGDIVAQLGHALGAMAAKGVAHGALSPENIFLARTHRPDATSKVKVLGFNVEALSPAAPAVREGAPSAAFAAPEQSEPGKRVTPAADAWALGLIAFRLLTGRMYWAALNERGTPEALSRERLSDPLKPASMRASQLEVPGALPLGFDSWFSRCVTRAVSERFASGDEAARALTPLLKSTSWSDAPANGSAPAGPPPFAQHPAGPPPGYANAPPGWGAAPPNPPFAQATRGFGPPPPRAGVAPGLLFAIVGIGLVVMLGLLAGGAYFLIKKPAPVPVTAGPSPYSGPAFDDSDSPVPVSSDDPVWGARDAPVTLVVFSDFECPFCLRLETSTLEQIKERYSPDKLRIVRKDNPLAFHKNARPAALAGEAVLRLGGSAAFWKFHASAFNNQRNLTPESFAQWAEAAGVSRSSFTAAVSSAAVAAEVDKDMGLAKKLGVKGTPASFVNGILLSGAQPVDKFVDLIDKQLVEAAKERAAGTSPDRLYVKLSQRNFANAAPSTSASAATPPENDKTVWYVPVGSSPVRGPRTALVTIVYWSDFQCPFCAKVEPVLAQVAEIYGGTARFVWKDNPLGFHPRAEPAAQMAREARAQKGDAGFWQAQSLLFARRPAGSQPWLEDTHLLGYARELGLDAARVQAAIGGHKYATEIQRDQELADDLGASGTPTFYINGRKLTGAQPLETFKAVIEQEIAKAEAMVQRGVAAADVYEAIIAEGKRPAGLERRSVEPPTAKSPWKGRADAPVTIQVFGDFQCPFCKRWATSTMGEIERAYAGRVKLVWRHLPLAMHADAALAAEAAQEVWTQKGSAAFWAYADKLWIGQIGDGLSRASLERYAEEVDVDVARFRQALDARTHKALVEADTNAANRAGIMATPAFIINGYYVSGAQPMVKFRRVIDAALDELKVEKE